MVQVRGATDGPLALPLLTVYGDRTVVAATDDGWLTGQVGEGLLQQFLDDAEAVGLLDADIVRRDAQRSDQAPDISVVIDLIDERLVHQLDVVEIDESEALWAFLVRSTTQNVFGLTEPFVGTWITCSSTELDSCREVAEPTSPGDRPILRGESTAEVLA